MKKNLPTQTPKFHPGKQEPPRGPIPVPIYHIISDISLQ